MFILFKNSPPSSSGSWQYQQDPKRNGIQTRGEDGASRIDCENCAVRLNSLANPRV